MDASQILLAPIVSEKSYAGTSFGKYTFEVLSSRLQPGCAEPAIVNGILGLIDGSRGSH